MRYAIRQLYRTDLWIWIWCSPTLCLYAFLQPLCSCL